MDPKLLFGTGCALAAVYVIYDLLQPEAPPAQKKKKKDDAAKSGRSLLLIVPVLIIAVVAAGMKFRMKEIKESIMSSKSLRGICAGIPFVKQLDWTDPGGWNDDYEEVDETLRTCTIDRRLSCEACEDSEIFGDCASCLKAEEFHADYKNKKPVIVRGLMEDWHARYNWDEGNFTREYGGATLFVNNGFALVDNVDQMSLADAVEKM